MRYPAFSASFSPPRGSVREPIATLDPGGLAMVPPPRREHDLPCPVQLAALGTVLCLYRPSLGSELAGWSRANTLAVQLQMDSDGLRESLWFFDRDGHCCWRLYLLPESDFLAWDRLALMAPSLPGQDNGAGIGERLWRRLANRICGDAWRLSVLRLHAIGRLGEDLAASPAPLSVLGAALLGRVAQEEGLDLPVVSAMQDGGYNNRARTAPPHALVASSRMPL